MDDDLTNSNLSSKKATRVFLQRNDPWCVGDGPTDQNVAFLTHFMKAIERNSHPTKKGASRFLWLLFVLGKCLNITR